MSDSARRRRLVLALIARDGGSCWLCGEAMDLEDPPTSPMRRATLDHVVERRNGGRTILENLRLAHARCNMHRDKKFPHTAGPGNDVPPKKQRPRGLAYRLWMERLIP